jgi:putative heme iron utilization protein
MQGVTGCADYGSFGAQFATRLVRGATIIVVVQVNKSQEMPTKTETAADARSHVRRSTKASLATIDARNGYPYASLVIMATDSAGAPTLLISNLARHTANLVNDARASVLVDGTGALADPLQGARLTLWGRAEKAPEEAVRRRYLARHSEAKLFADFPDFGFWRLAVEGAHYIGGFGRIFDLAPDELLVSLEGADALLEAEPGIVAHMNDDHADAIALYATVLAGAEPGPWRMVGIDPEGCDIASTTDVRRIVFAAPIATPAEARKELVRLAAAAREGR